MISVISVRYATLMTGFAQSDGLALQRAALDKLKLIGEVTRYQAEAIRFAAEVGIPKQKIHELTGRSRSAINQTLDREAQRLRPPCDYCIHEHFQAARRGEEVPPLRDATGYLLFRVGKRPEIIAQRLCLPHMSDDCNSRLPSSARWVAAPFMPNTPGRIVYSLGGLRDDTEVFRSYFRRFDEWDQIQTLLEPSSVQ